MRVRLCRNARARPHVGERTGAGPTIASYAVAEAVGRADKQVVILSGVAASRSEAATESKDPYHSDNPSEASRHSPRPERA